MEFFPERLVRGIKRVQPNATGFNVPTATPTNNGDKVNHALGKLAQAGVAGGVDSSILGLPTTTSTSYPQKITHAIEKLTNAGMSGDNSGSSVTATTSKSSGHHGLATKFIIVIAVVGAVILLALLGGGCLCWRRYKRRRAYNVVSRGIDNTGKLPMRSREDVFNADIREAESFTVPVDAPGQKLTERNFESGYDNVDTGYEGTGYGGVDEHAGDKRARLEA